MVSIYPHDVWDFDATNPVVLTDMKIDGVKKVLQPNRNGYVYVIDASMVLLKANMWINLIGRRAR